MFYIFVLIGVAGIILGFLCGYTIKWFKVKTFNNEIINQEKEEQEKLDKIISDKCRYTADVEALRDNLKKLGEWRYAEDEKFKQAVKDHEDRINSLQATAKKSADEYYQKEHELADSHLNDEKKRMQDYFSNLINNYREEYLEMLEECTEHYQETIGECDQELDAKIQELTNLRRTIDALVETNKRQLLKETQRDFYRLNVPQTDLNEIAKLREVSQYLKNAEPLNKVIWKVYYEKPYTDLIGRVVGTEEKTGIYKITNLKNNMCYVGQATNIASRFRQHIKRGLGAETPTRNKLYPAMMAEGVENFSFEIIEECVPAELNTREKYWIECYHGQDFGYNIKAGG